jgi:DNA mismatch repair protein MutL
LFEKFYENQAVDEPIKEAQVDIRSEIKTDDSLIQPLILATHKGKRFDGVKKRIEILTFDKIEQINEPVLFKEDITQRVFFNIIGQIKNSFIIFETENGIGIFDQHAAHERKLYEMMKHSLNKDSAQKLLIPIELNLNLEKIEFLNAKKNIFEEKGIIIDGQTLTHIPNLLNCHDFKVFLEQEIQIYTEPCVLIDRLFADIACKNALKANTKLSIEQMHSLLSDALINPPVCNHGRPVFKYFSMNEINNWFKR